MCSRGARVGAGRDHDGFQCANGRNASYGRKVAAKARRHLYVVARTDAAASEGIEGAVARTRLYVEAGADAIVPEALTTADMFREFADRLPGVPLLANMTEFGRTPFFTTTEFERMGHRMVIWPVASLCVANKAQERLYCVISSLL